MLSNYLQKVLDNIVPILWKMYFSNLLLFLSLLYEQFLRLGHAVPGNFLEQN